jgi:hypothetical protein
MWSSQWLATAFAKSLIWSTVWLLIALTAPLVKAAHGWVSLPFRAFAPRSENEKSRHYCLPRIFTHPQPSGRSATPSPSRPECQSRAPSRRQSLPAREHSGTGRGPRGATGSTAQPLCACLFAAWSSLVVTFVANTAMLFASGSITGKPSMISASSGGLKSSFVIKPFSPPNVR